MVAYAGFQGIFTALVPHSVNLRLLERLTQNMSRYFHFAALLCALPCLLRAQANRVALTEAFLHFDSISASMETQGLKKVVEASKEMLDIAQQLQVDTLIFHAWEVQGTALHLLGNFDGALKIFYDNLAKSEQQLNGPYQVTFATLIGRSYQSMNDFEKSQVFMRKAKKYAIDCANYRDTIAINYEIGFNMVAMENDIAGGIRIIEQNLAAARQINDKKNILLGIDNLSNLWANLGEPQKALDYELELLPLVEGEDFVVQKIAFFEHLSEIYVMLEQWDNAQVFQQRALNKANSVGANDWIYECYKLQAMIDEGRGNYKSALKNHQRYLELKDSVYQNQYDEKMSAMSALYELESKQNTIALLEKDTKIKESQIEEQRILMLLGLLALISIVLAIQFLHQRKTSKLREIFAQDLLKAQEKERQKISRELHDSVGQNILFIKNRLQRLTPAPDAPLVKSVDDALEEVRNIAKDLYPNQLEQYGLASAVDALCTVVHESSGIFVSCDLQGVDDKLNKDAKINCYRIIQECINNTIKHAEATAIRISANVLSSKVEFVVQDNGKGFDKTLLERQAMRSFGLINIAERIKMLRGKFELETAANKGAKLSFIIPV
jgi:signal transduction histidine kinase